VEPIGDKLITLFFLNKATTLKLLSTVTHQSVALVTCPRSGFDARTASASWNPILIATEVPWLVWEINLLLF
jgi:hypothetical protein